jgi:hypothetical protein
MTEKETKSYWSDCAQVFFDSGYGWGVMEDGRTICLGNENAILEAFQTGKLDSELSPLQRAHLGKILECREAEGFGTREGDMVGAGHDGTARRKQKATRKLDKKQRLALRSAHKKY